MDKTYTKGNKKISSKTFYLEEDAADWHDDNTWNYYLSLGEDDFDGIFGTCVCAPENDDYINIYAISSFDYTEIEDDLLVMLHKADGSDVELFYKLSDIEKNIVHHAILQHEIERLNKLSAQTAHKATEQEFGKEKYEATAYKYIGDRVDVESTDILSIKCFDSFQKTQEYLSRISNYQPNFAKGTIVDGQGEVCADYFSSDEYEIYYE